MSHTSAGDIALRITTVSGEVLESYGDHAVKVYEAVNSAGARGEGWARVDLENGGTYIIVLDNLIDIEYRVRN